MKLRDLDTSGRCSALCAECAVRDWFRAEDRDGYDLGLLVLLGLLGAA